MANTDVKATVKNVHAMTMHVKISRELTARLWAARQLIKTAAWVAGMGIEIEEVDNG